NYQLTGQGEYIVNVTETGADQTDISFYYQVVVQPATITIRYIDQNNQEFASEQRELQPGVNTVTPDASRVPQGYELTSQAEFIVNVTEQGADQTDIAFYYKAAVQPATVTIHFRDQQDGQPVANSITTTYPEGSHDVYAQPENLKEGYTLIGPDVQTVTVSAQGADPAEIIFNYQAPAEAPTEEPIPDAQVQVHYQDDKGNPVADTQVVTLPAGPHVLRPTPTNLLEGYALTEPESFDIVVDINGASRTAVTFVYELTSPVSRPVDVPVYYVDEAGKHVASSAVFTAGEGKHGFQAAPADLQEGYALKEGEDPVKYVTVTNNQANPSSLTFIYQKIIAPTDTPVPAPKAALVKVLYKSEDGETLYSTTVPCKEGEQTVIDVNLGNVNTTMYQLMSEASHTITVDKNGNPSQQEIIFLFKDITVKTATIDIHYRDEAGKTLAPSGSKTIEPGTTAIHAQPEGLKEGYVLVGQSPVDVVLSESGAKSQEEVVFVYTIPATDTPTPTQTPEPTLIPFDVTPMDRYAYPTGDQVNFRSSPDASSSANNAIDTLSKKDLIHVLGTLKNRQGEEWYLADVKGKEGFIKAAVARLLTFNEVAAIFGWTPEPTATPAPSNDPMKDGEIIDRWAEVSAKGGVNMRAKPEKGSSRITALDTGERIWVFTQQTVGSDVWYSVRANGKDGFVMAEFLRLYSKQESEQYQATLASPMPYAATPTPAAASDTPVPETAAPTASTPPTVSPTPALYQGPALTIRQSALRTGIGRPDEPVLEMLEVNTLVQVWNQTWIDDEGWSQVQVMADKQIGYVPNASLRYIDDQEAAFYLQQLEPKVTEAPTRPPEQRVGYSITRGENVPVRAFPDTNAQIVTLLPEGAVVGVRGQDYAASASWDVVQYGTFMGYVRSDQLRMLTPTEQQNYLDSLRTPTPAPAFTPEPVTLNSPSSYGYVTKVVNFRKQPSTSAEKISSLKTNAFALVLGTEIIDGVTWYKINQAGTVGYVMGDYFKVLTLSELTAYLAQN
ncbi:MAG: SH3 domain-containing protein, partial [Clostridiales bacterium]|nr:SH3 domain-containing protein [Clostridiales bacterium]